MHCNNVLMSALAYLYTSLAYHRLPLTTRIKKLVCTVIMPVFCMSALAYLYTSLAYHGLPLTTRIKKTLCTVIMLFFDVSPGVPVHEPGLPQAPPHHQDQEDILQASAPSTSR